MATDVHDQTVKALQLALQDYCRAHGKYRVLTGVQWVSHDGFPNLIDTYDVAIVPADSELDSKPNVSFRQAPISIFEIVSEESLERDFHSKTDLLLQSSLTEYVLYDPTREFLRPALQGFRKWEDRWLWSKSCIRGTFESQIGFRLEFEGESIKLELSPEFGWKDRMKKLLKRRRVMERRGDRVGTDRLTSRIEKHRRLKPDPRDVFDL